MKILSTTTLKQQLIQDMADIYYRSTNTQTNIVTWLDLNYNVLVITNQQSLEQKYQKALQLAIENIEL